MALGRGWLLSARRKWCLWEGKQVEGNPAYRKNMSMIWDVEGSWTTGDFLRNKR
jgi:hypothetical protein